MEFNPDGEPMSFLEKAIIMIFWFLTEVVGSILLIGLIQFERLGGDPLKGRIVDQISGHSNFSCSHKLLDLLGT